MYKVYLIASQDNHYKIGYTKREVKNRLKELKTGNSQTLDVISIFESKWGNKIESYLHRRFKDKKIDGEWFELNDYDVNNFISLCVSHHEALEILDKENTYILERGGLK